MLVMFIILIIIFVTSTMYIAPDNLYSCFQYIREEIKKMRNKNKLIQEQEEKPFVTHAKKVFIYGKFKKPRDVPKLTENVEYVFLNDLKILKVALYSRTKDFNIKIYINDLPSIDLERQNNDVVVMGTDKIESVFLVPEKQSIYILDITPKSIMINRKEVFKFKEKQEINIKKFILHSSQIKSLFVKEFSLNKKKKKCSL